MNIEIALAWLDRNDWPSWEEIDPAIPAYEQWLADAEERCRVARQHGVSVNRIAVEPKQFMIWCKVKGFEPTEAARAHYAGAVFAKRPKE